MDVTRDFCNIPLLKQAQALNDIDCFRILQDVRLENGNFALDINQIKHGTTVLDDAVKVGVLNRAMIKAIKDLGGVTAAQAESVKIEQQQRQVPEIKKVIKPQTTYQQTEQVQNFNANNQNTHDPSVTQTALGSLNSLNKRYGEFVDENLAIKDLKSFIETFDYSSILKHKANKKESVKHFFASLEGKFDSIHSYSELSIKKIMVLVWMGVIDDDWSAYPEEIRVTYASQNLAKAPNSLVKLKKESLIEKCIEAFDTYRDMGTNLNICTGGAVHKLLESLNQAHTDVVITTGSQAIKEAANDMTRSLAGAQLRKETEAQRHKILSSWNEEDSVAVSFKESIKIPIDMALQEQFGTLLKENERCEIINCIPQLPRPGFPHKALNELVDQIENTLIATGSSGRKKCVNHLLKEATEIYFKKGSYEENHIFLKKKYEGFLKIDAVVNDITAIPYDKKNEHRQKAITFLKGNALCFWNFDENQYNKMNNKLETDDQLSEFDKVFSIFQEKYVFLKEKYKGFLKIDAVVKDITAIPDDNNNARRQKTITFLKGKALSLWDFESNHNESLDLLKKKYEDFVTLDEKINAVVKTITALPDDIKSVRRQKVITFLKDKALSLWDFDKNQSDEHIEEVKLFSQKFFEFDKVFSTLEKIKVQYTEKTKNQLRGKNKERLNSIENIINQVSIASERFQDPANLNKLELIPQDLIKEIEIIGKAVHIDHCTHGALRYFGKFQPQSRLEKIISSTLKQLTVNT